MDKHAERFFIPTGTLPYDGFRAKEDIEYRFDISRTAQSILLWLSRARGAATYDYNFAVFLFFIRFFQ